LSQLSDYYRAGIRLGVQRDVQYRGGMVVSLLGFLIEPVVYLTVWTTVAESQGGAIGGFTTGELAAYYIVWTLVRVYNLAHAPTAWEWRIRGGRLNEFLSAPIHPFHRDMTFFIGGKFMWTIAWVPVAALLTLAFRPTFSFSVVGVIGFVIAIWGGFLVRFVLLYLMGMITFWTTRATAMFEIIVAMELILSGRLVPLSLLPEWAQGVAGWMPFRWYFEFPIQVMIGRVDTPQIIIGILAQFAWAAGLGLAFYYVWKRAIRRYSAVGG
jgi:ABC-2 type transport system permease protein